MSIESVLDFWLGPLDERGMATPEKQRRWWVKDPAFDERVRTEFGALHGSVVAGEHEAWRETPRGLVAYVIVLDQFSRNLFRADPRMYANDVRATKAARTGMEAGLDAELGLHERFFLYMPFMHCETLPEQERCILLMEKLAAEHDSLEQNVKYAIAHRDIVARFGRFPHRNDILGRECTPEEAEFLEQPGSSF